MRPRQAKFFLEASRAGVNSKKIGSPTGWSDLWLRRLAFRASTVHSQPSRATHARAVRCIGQRFFLCVWDTSSILIFVHAMGHPAE
jgi:hypothetical protein